MKAKCPDASCCSHIFTMANSGTFLNRSWQSLSLFAGLNKQIFKFSGLLFFKYVGRQFYQNKEDKY